MGKLMRIRTELSEAAQYLDEHLTISDDGEMSIEGDVQYFMTCVQMLVAELRK